METKESQVKKYNTLIDQSEDALNKMIANTQKLSDTLTQALSNDALWEAECDLICKNLE